VHHSTVRPARRGTRRGAAPGALRHGEALALMLGWQVGVVGFGRIGQAVAKRLKAFGCTVLYTGPREKPEGAAVGAEFVDEAELFSRSDFVVPMFPLTAETTGYFNAARWVPRKHQCSAGREKPGSAPASFQVR